VREKVSYPHKTTGNIIFYKYSCSCFYTAERRTKDFEMNDGKHPMYLICSKFLQDAFYNEQELHDTINILAGGEED
jgi:hypothetical protein